MSRLVLLRTGQPPRQSFFYGHLNIKNTKYNYKKLIVLPYYQYNNRFFFTISN